MCLTSCHFELFCTILHYSYADGTQLYLSQKKSNIVFTDIEQCELEIKVWMNPYLLDPLASATDWCFL